MAKHVSPQANRQSLGDAAVDGLCSGFFAGVVMGIYWIIVGLLAGIDAGAVFVVISPTGTVLTGLIAHLALAAIYGAGFGIGLGSLASHGRTAVRLWAGPIYGAMLAFLVRTLIPDQLLTFAGAPGYHVWLSHLLYGFVLGLGFSRVVHV
jgi:hypothetical protein